MGSIADGQAFKATSAQRRRQQRQSLLTRRRFQFAGALVLGALLPWFLRGPILPGTMAEPSSMNTLVANTIAIVIAFWMRLSIETYPGIRRSYVIFPSALMVTSGSRLASIRLRAYWAV